MSCNWQKFFRYLGIVFIISNVGLSGCVSTDDPTQTSNTQNTGYVDLTNNGSLEQMVLASTQIVGKCNIVVDVVNSNNTNIGNSMHCPRDNDRTEDDSQYCIQQSEQQYTDIYPAGILTLPLFPFFALYNYASKVNAGNNATVEYTSCMESRGHTKDGYGEYTFDNGNSYRGNWKNWLFDGHGDFYWKDGGSYEGDWKNGQKNGNGFDILSDGSIYKGVFQNDVYSGYGVLTWPDGRRFEGTFSDGRPNGKGVFTTANGDRYEGDWSDGCFKNGNIFAYINQNPNYCR